MVEIGEPAGLEPQLRSVRQLVERLGQPRQMQEGRGACQPHSHFAWLRGMSTDDEIGPSDERHEFECSNRKPNQNALQEIGRDNRHKGRRPDRHRQGAVSHEQLPRVAQAHQTPAGHHQNAGERGGRDLTEQPRCCKDQRKQPDAV